MKQLFVIDRFNIQLHPSLTIPFPPRDQAISKIMYTCAGCGTEIRDKHLLLSMDRHWHINCLKCSCCGIRLDDVASKCYFKSGLILCQRDYIRCVMTVIIVIIFKLTCIYFLSRQDLLYPHSTAKVWYVQWIYISFFDPFKYL